MLISQLPLHPEWDIKAIYQSFTSYYIFLHSINALFLTFPETFYGTTESLQQIFLCINFNTTLTRVSFFFYLQFTLCMHPPHKSVCLCNHYCFFLDSQVIHLDFPHSYHTIPSSSSQQAVSLTEGDYTKALTWTTQRQISSICHHSAISIPANDKWPRKTFFFLWKCFLSRNAWVIISVANTG